MPYYEGIVFIGFDKSIEEIRRTKKDIDFHGIFEVEYIKEKYRIHFINHYGKIEYVGFVDSNGILSKYPHRKDVDNQLFVKWDMTEEEIVMAKKDLDVHAIYIQNDSISINFIDFYGNVINVICKIGESMNTQKLKKGLMILPLTIGLYQLKK